MVGADWRVRLPLPAGFRARLRILRFPHLRSARRRSRYPVPDNRHGRDLTPWSTTYYSTRSADLLRSPQAEIGSARASISAIQNDRPRSFASKYQSLGASDRRSPTLAFADAIYLSLGRRHRSARLKRRRTRRGPCLEPQRAGGTRGVCLCRRDSLGRVLTSSIRGAHRRTFQQVFLHRRASALCLHFVRRYAQFALHPRRTEILPDSRRATPPPFAPR
jgi:hypothetical protein